MGNSIFFILQGGAGDGAGLDMHQTVDENGGGRKAGRKAPSLSICPLSHCLLINTCKCSVYCVFASFTREIFELSLRAFSTTSDAAQTFTPLFKEQVHNENIQTQRKIGYHLIPVLCGQYYCITVLL